MKTGVTIAGVRCYLYSVVPAAGDKHVWNGGVVHQGKHTTLVAIHDVTAITKHTHHRLMVYHTKYTFLQRKKMSRRTKI